MSSTSVRKKNVGTSVVVPSMYWVRSVVIGKAAPIPVAAPRFAPNAPVADFHAESLKAVVVHTRWSAADPAGFVLSSR